MRIRGRLFIKIFLGFWLVSTAVLASWLIAAQYFETHPSVTSLPPPGGPWAEDRRHPAYAGRRPPRFMLRAVYALQHEPAEQLPELVETISKEHGIDVYLLDRSGTALLDQEIPAAVSEVAGLVDRNRRRATGDSKIGRLLAHEIFRRDLGPVRAVFVLPHQPNRWLGLLGENLWLRLGLAILISGLICYGLSRLVTSRLRELRQASRSFADGELGTRIAVQDQGGDETDELARDFNGMAAQIEERIQAQKRLLGDVSHELRSPLARLRIALALAQEDTDNSAAHLARIEREAERLEELIAQLLSSQVESIDFDAHIDLVPLLQQLCADASFEGRGENKLVSFNTDVDVALVASTGDLLHKSFDNILRNALQHTAAGSVVQVGLHREQDGFRLRFEDQGPGIPAAELSRIFDEFYRVDTARTRTTGGYGLGLAISRRALLRHGGSIEAANTGTGLAVNVFLPARQ